MSLLHTSAPYQRGENDHVRVPAVLPLVQVQINDGGLLDVTIDHIGYDTDPASTREDLHRVLEEITGDLASPLKLEIREPDGSVFTDIITPDPQRNDQRQKSQPPNATLLPGEVAGEGFLPDEEVAVAVVVAHQVADADGTARLRLPPALLAGRPGTVVLLGRTSHAIAVSGGAE